MKLKLDANGQVVTEKVGDEVRPVYVDKDGKDVAFDVLGTVGTIARLNKEAQGHRERAETAEGKVKLFEGIEDPQAARDALKTVKNLGDKKLVDAGEVDKVKDEVRKAVEAQYKPHVERAEKLEKRLKSEGIGGAFARSPLLVGDKAILNIPADLVQARFGQHFDLDVETGKIVATDSQGNKLYSRSNPGELASFDEALSMIVDAYPHKDSILKGSGASGSGARGGSEGGGSGGKTMTRQAFNALSPGEQATAARSHTITD